MQKATQVKEAAVSDQLPGVSVIFQAKPPHSRFNVVLSAPAGQELDNELTGALTAIGFNQRRLQLSRKGVVTESFESEGDGLCGGWTATERDRLTRDARRTLRRFGFTMVPEIRE